MCPTAWQTRTSHQAIQRLLRQLAAASLVTLPVDVSTELLDEQMDVLMSHRDKLTAELDALQKDLAEVERDRAATEARYNQNSWDSIGMDLQEVVNELETMKRKIAVALGDPPSTAEIDAMTRKVRSCIERSENHPPALRPYTTHDLGLPWHTSPEAAALMKRVSSRQAALDAVADRIAEVDRLLIGPRVFDPEVDRIRRAAGRLHEATMRVEDLEQRLSNPRPPAVTVLGSVD